MRLWLGVVLLAVLTVAPIQAAEEIAPGVYSVLVDAPDDSTGVAPSQELLGVQLKVRSDGDDGWIWGVAAEVAGVEVTDVTTIDVTWAAASFHNPAQVTSERGVRFVVQAGAATWTPLLLADGTWTTGTGGSVAIIDGTNIVADEVTVGGGGLPHLAQFQAAASNAIGVVDEAVGEVEVAAPGPYRLVDVIHPPSRAPDMTDEVGDQETAADLEAVWLDVHTGGFDVTYQYPSLTPEDIEQCEWFRQSFFALDLRQGEHLQASVFNSLQFTEQGVVLYAWPGGDMTTGTGEDAVETPFMVEVEIAYGAPAYVQARVVGATWDGVETSYNSWSASCNSQKTEERENLTTGSSVGGFRPKDLPPISAGIIIAAVAFELILLAALVGGAVVYFRYLVRE